MQNRNIILLVQNLGNMGKLAVIAGLLVFVGLLYLIWPKLMDSKFRGYYQQCDEEEWEAAEQESLEEDKKE